MKPDSAALGMFAATAVGIAPQQALLLGLAAGVANAPPLLAVVAAMLMRPATQPTVVAAASSDPGQSLPAEVPAEASATSDPSAEEVVVVREEIFVEEILVTNETGAGSKKQQRQAFRKSSREPDPES